MATTAMTIATSMLDNRTDFAQRGNRSGLMSPPRDDLV